MCLFKKFDLVKDFAHNSHLYFTCPLDFNETNELLTMLIILRLILDL